ncbi:SURF1 family protein [Aliidiomarina sp. Khilg15.8]
MPSLRVGKQHFRFHPAALVVTLLAIAIMVKLGFWQIDRGLEKQSIIDNHAAGEQASPQRLTTALIEQGDLVTDTVIETQGEFTPGQYFLIDNQTWNGRVGYQVVALLSSETFAPYTLPVNLGWVPLPGTRDYLPEIQLPLGEVKVHGRVHIPAEKPFMLNDQVFTDSLPQRVQYLELEALAEHLEQPIAPFSLLLDEELELGFAREWPVVVMEPHRHYGYTLQWFGLALAALIIFVVASRVNKNSEESQ